jgi:hypothetical protein
MASDLHAQDRRESKEESIMDQPIQRTITTPSERTLLSRSPLRLRRGFFLIPFAIALAWFALSPAARAVSPAPDGGYPNFNTAEGQDALLSLTTGCCNTATGFTALRDNATASNNTATGSAALRFNTTGVDNTATGFAALQSNTTGKNNIALGAAAGVNLTTGDNNIDIGNLGVAGESNKIRIGTVGTQNKTFIAGIRDATVADGVGVIVGPNGKLGTVISSARFKEAIKPMEKASEAILALKPVTFRYKHELDPEGIPQFGLVAEQVEKVNPDLVARDGHGKVDTVRYEAVNAMLLNEFLKEHRKVKRLEAAIARQQEEIKALIASVKVQALQTRKVSVQLEVSKATPQMAVNNQ